MLTCGMIGTLWMTMKTIREITPAARRAHAVRVAVATIRVALAMWDPILRTLQLTAARFAGSDGNEESIMDYCRSHVNEGPWIPGLNDCHDRADVCLWANGYKAPSHPRFLRCLVVRAPQAGRLGKTMRLLKYNAAVSAAFLLLWLLIVLVEVRVAPFPVLKYVFFLFPPMHINCFFSGKSTCFFYPQTADKPTIRAAIMTVLMAPSVIFLGVVVAVNFSS